MTIDIDPVIVHLRPFAVTFILADEPTPNLDSKIGHEITRLLRRVAKERGRRSIVIVSDGCRDEFLAAPYRFFADADASGRPETSLRQAVRREAALAGARK
jgi:ABC-type thiamine transport system ATPase subunit